MSDHRLDANRPGVCSNLHSKSLYVWSEPDPTVPRSNEGLFWCALTQTCIGPDGKLAEPGNCCSHERDCHCENEK
jgi:hypothetical protein